MVTFCHRLLHWLWARHSSVTCNVCQVQWKDRWRDAWAEPVQRT